VPPIALPVRETGRHQPNRAPSTCGCGSQYRQAMKPMQIRNADTGNDQVDPAPPCLLESLRKPKAKRSPAAFPESRRGILPRARTREDRSIAGKHRPSRCEIDPPPPPENRPKTEAGGKTASRRSHQKPAHACWLRLSRVKKLFWGWNSPNPATIGVIALHGHARACVAVNDK
jgi:hypothetical protein